MKNSFISGRTTRQPQGKNSFVAGLLALILLLVASMPVLAKEGELGKDELTCLACHDKPGVEKKLDNGETLSLQISTKAYAESMHSGTSCADCHTDIDSKSHGKEKSAIKSKRDFSNSMRESCRDCHRQKFTEYDDSVHAKLVKGGSKTAPLCADCHNPHTVRSWKVAESVAAPPCAKCHVDIFKAYSGDVHGQANRANSKDAPVCAGCHRAHNVKAASLGEGVRDTCLACHKDAPNQHKDWLPNTERHFDAISCPACHAPAAQRRVNLRLYEGAGAAKQQLSEKTGVPQFEKRTGAADGGNVGLDERALWSLLKEFSRDGGQGKAVLRGRLEVRSGVEAHQLTEKSKAIKDCMTCHQAGAEPFQSVSVTIAGPDGRPLRHGVQKEVLNSLLSIESVKGFYALGSTRIKLLDNLLVLVVLGSIGGPLAHMTAKWWFRRAREKRAAEALAGADDAASETPPGDQRGTDAPTK